MAGEIFFRMKGSNEIYRQRKNKKKIVNNPTLKEWLNNFSKQKGNCNGRKLELQKRKKKMRMNKYVGKHNRFSSSEFLKSYVLVESNITPYDVVLVYKRNT